MYLVYYIIYEARTRCQRCRTHVQRGGTRWRTGYADARMSSHIPPRCATWIPRAFRRLAPTRADAAPIRVDSQGIGPIQAEIQKKKKGADRTVWLISKPYFSPISHKRQNISSFPHISSLTSLVSVLSASLPRLPCCYETLNHSTLTQFAASVHSFFSSLSRILNLGIIIKLSILV